MSATPGPPGHRPPDGLPPELDPRGRRRAKALAAGTADRTPVQKARVGAHRIGSVTRVLAAVLSLAILIGSGWAWASYKKFDGAIAEGQSLPTGGTDIDGKDQNILLVGNDSRAGATAAELAELSTADDGGSANTDTMILLHVPADGRAATMVSFPRDSYVDIPGYGSDRINAAFPDAYNAAKAAGQDETAAQGAGLALTAATISELTGLHIDHYLQVNLLGFYRISKAVGGVQVCLNAAMTPGTDGDTGNGLDSGYENGEYVASYSGIDLPAGVSTIDGKQALAFVRQRHGLPNGDLDRVVRQQYFLKATFAQVKSLGVLLNPFKLNELLDAVSSSLLKDPALNLLDLASQVQGLATGNITSVTMVTEGDDTIDGKAVLAVDPDAVKAQMSALIGTPADDAYAKATAVDPTTVAVSVLNGSDVGGAASTTADQLRALGFQVPDSAVGNADTAATTTIRYPDGMQAQAKTLAAQVPGAQVTVDPSVQGVTLVLGSDGVGVGTAPAPVDPATPATPAAGASSGTVPNAPANGLGCIN